MVDILAPLSFSFGGLFGAKEKRPAVKPYAESGVLGSSIVGGWIVDRERNPKLSYLRRNTSYEEVMSNIAVVGAGVRYFTSLAASAVWSVEASEADTTGEYAEFVERMMDTVDQPWSTVVKQALFYRYLGFSVQEMTAFKDDDGSILLKSIENRPQRTIERFDVNDNGNVLGFGQRAPSSGQEFYIPRAKCLYVVDNLIDDSPAGMGILRHVFESCERLSSLMKTELAGFERDLRGIPIGRIPYSELNQAVNNGEITSDQAQSAISAMERLVSMSKRLPESGITLDSKNYQSRSDTGIAVTGNRQWDLELLQGQSPGIQEVGLAIERIQKEIARVLSSEAQLLDGGGSNAMSKDKSSNAYLAVNSALSDVKDQANKDILPFLWKLNGFDSKTMPKFEVEEVSARDAESVAIVLKDMATAGATLAPDDPAINSIRSMLGIEQVDLDRAALLVAEDRNMQMQQHEASLVTE